MSGEKKDNSGVLFKNEKKAADTDPLYTGQALIDGSEYWLSAWVNHTKEGKSYMKLAFRAKSDAAPSKAQPKPAEKELDDDIPF